MERNKSRALENADVVQPREASHFGEPPVIGVKLLEESYEREFGPCEWLEDPSLLLGFDS